MEQQSDIFGLNLDHQTQQYLAETAKWGKFLSIIGFILICLLVIAGIFMGSVMATLSEYNELGVIGGGAFSMIYITGALIYFFPTFFLYKFSSAMQVALRNSDQQQLTESFKNLKSCFKFIGILTLIMIGIYVLIFMFGIIAGAASAF
jgi:hypothetical protein